MHDPVIEIIVNDISIGYLKVLEAIIKMQNFRSNILVSELQYRFKKDITPILSDLCEIGLIEIKHISHAYYEIVFLVE